MASTGKLQTLAQRIRHRREQLGLTREYLAEALGITVQSVQQWESGQTKNIKLPTFIALADALNVSTRWLAEGRGNFEALPSMDAYSVALGRRDEAADPETKRAWEQIAAAFARAATVILFLMGSLVASHKAEAEAIYHNVNVQPFFMVKYPGRLHIGSLFHACKQWLLSLFNLLQDRVIA